LTRALLVQVVALQSPEDVRCMAYFPENVASEWSWLKWLPHVRRLRHIKAEKRNTPEHVCMLSHTAEEVSNLIFNQIKPEMDRRRPLSEDKRRDKNVPITLPHLVVIFDPFSPFGALGQIPELEQLLNDAAEFGATVICLVEDPSQEPAQVQARISLTAIGILNYQEIKRGGERSEGVAANGLDPKMCERIARSMAPLLLAEAGAQQDLSQDVRLLDLLGIVAADAFELAKTWRARERFEILKVPLGVRADGEPLMIDFKEAADKGMGPHGLCIGATGSGKSELL